ncbi:MAG: hypothetical protein HOJ48_01220 [Desulfobacula sp.]|nr:hypothetical protein [Desulfobacula sp.]MBT6337895.1 hypothetical protein [Desulfobacula sp.]
MKIFILNGPAEAGKGTLVEYFKESTWLDTHSYSSIDWIKKVAKKEFGWDGVKDARGRNLLAGLKQVAIAYNDIPTKKVILEIESAIVFKIDLLFVDIREPDEIEKLVTHCKTVGLPCVAVRVINTQAELKAEKNGLSLTGDRLYGEYSYDIEIENNSTMEAFKKNIEIKMKEYLV